MSTTLIEIRRAKAADAEAVAATHDEAWRTAYQGIIPGAELEKLISRRGPAWWDSAIRKGSRVVLLVFGDRIAGYANYGRDRARSLFYDGEIYELYLRPEFQRLVFGRPLLTAACKDLGHDLDGLGECHIANDAAAAVARRHAVDADVDHGRARLDPAAAHHFGTAGRREQEVGAPAGRRQIAGLGMGDRDGRALAQQQ